MEKEKRPFEVELEDGKKVELTTRAPSNEELQKSEFEYSKEFNKAIVSGILPQARLVSELTKNGIWSDDKEEQIEEKREAIIAMEEKLETIESESEKKAFAEQVGEERKNLLDMRQEKNDMLAHSAEVKAENAQRNFLVSCVTEYKASGAKVWRDFKAFSEEEESNMLFVSTYEYLTFINGLPSNFATGLPENQVDEADAEEGSEETKEETPVETPAESQTVTEEDGKEVSARVEE